jgi:hypothetical protein
MSARTSAQAFSDATAGLVQHYDLAEILARLVNDCAGVLGVDSVALMVKNDAGRLELLSATSHRANEIELFQIQHDRGPCIESVGTGAIVSACSEAEIIGRWGTVGTVIVEAGYGMVQAFPMRWHDDVLGSLNLFSTRPTGQDEVVPYIDGQAFADVATLALITSFELPLVDVTTRVSTAVAARSVIERAKGVLAFQRDIEVAAAYEVLVETARTQHRTLSEMATEVIRRAQNP